ncbi:caspase family protein [Propionivibrio dicarboxylicus]|uniref:Caspase domain-containing protein n=1 Tax=Propionivibrio dicarboxylicus TaxID=83767 RepID=A0A1G8I4R7_9RHOO|nr:caspase family protein [Propionivibrio dicarboxylicus]SDI13873.1 Caspase domain-containing protein [Propionivibrio dicarboxylicus]
MTAKHLACLVFVLFAGEAGAQFRPPAFVGGLPGVAQFQAVQMQRHQARTLLYREALDELRKNPAAADVPECQAGQSPKDALCLARPDAAPPVAMAQVPVVQSPVAQAPVVQAPVVQAPVAQAPVAQTPVAQAPVAQAPVAQTPVAQAPVAQAPVAQAPVAQAPVAQAPVAQAPVAETPAPVVAKSAQPVVPTPPRRIALLFGNNDYKPPIPGLETPIADVEDIASALRARFGYDVRVVKNASKAGIIESVNGIAGEARPEDSVLLFYAGHGYLMEDINMGFWIPIDGSVKTAANWISNKDISKLLTAIPARQLILISDSCFSGSLTREQKITGKGALQPDEVLRRRSVLVFSSGGDEPVSDEGKEGHSIFAWSLIKTLNEIGTTTAGHEVWRLVRGTVTKDYSQEPQYGAVLSAGHADGGEYLFQLR